jgi:hypothetical protein
MPPPGKFWSGGFKRLSHVIPIGKTQTARCQFTRRGMKKTSRPGLWYKALGCRVASMGPRVCQLLATHCVALSLTLSALGGADPIGRFCLETQSISRPMTIMRPILDTVCHISHYRKCDMWETGGACKHIERPLLHSTKACGLLTSAFTPWGPENKQMPLRTPTSSRTYSHRLLIVHLMIRERERKRGKQSKREKD